MVCIRRRVSYHWRSSSHARFCWWTCPKNKKRFHWLLFQLIAWFIEKHLWLRDWYKKTISGQVWTTFVLQNCPTCRQYFRTQIVSISRCKERGVTFLNFPVRFRRSTQSWSCDKVRYLKRFFRFWMLTKFLPNFLFGHWIHRPGIKNKINYARASQCSTTKFRNLFYKIRLFETDFSDMDCAELYRWEIRLELLQRIELRADLIQKADFRTFINYPDFWATLFSIPDYRNLSQKVISVLVLMPTNYLCKQGISGLVKIKSKERNSITMFIYKNQLRVLQFRYGGHEHTL